MTRTRNLTKLAIGLLLLALIINFAYRLDAERTPHELVGELMYFPSGYAVRALSMGFQTPLADIVWLRFIQYYGEHRLSDTRYDLMHHILDILTTLDPRFTYAYTLGGLMLIHDAARPDQAQKLLQKGMRQNPEEWRLPFMYAFMNYIFTKDYRTAKTYFGISAQKPNAPDMPKRWLAFVTYLKLGDLKTALSLWVDFYNGTDNPEEKQIAETYIKNIKMKMDIQFLNAAVGKFIATFGRKPSILSELVTFGIAESIPVEPHGGSYYLKGTETHSTLDSMGVQ
ncbi:MAG: hypothetical protein JSW49_05835 [candidate division WOR-3 bacterium]|nr:MAG: hypothetical protein JSW49_05835 [candidate division WOR-3 bacterium]